MNNLLFIGGLGGWEILLIVLVMVIFFGAKKIPELARGFAQGIGEFKKMGKELTDVKEDLDEDARELKKTVRDLKS